MNNTKLRLDQYHNRFPPAVKLLRLFWNVVWFFLFRPTPRGVLYGWRRFLLVLFGAKIGKGSRILPSCKVWQPWKLTMGNHSCIAGDVDCYTVDKITIGDHVVVSQGAFLCSASHDITSPTMELIHKPIRIESYAWVAARAFVGPGVHVGEGAVIAACAVVSKNVAPWTVVGGNPAAFIKERVLSDS